MTALTLESLMRATGCGMGVASVFVGPLNAAAGRWGIDTPQRVAAWLGQIAHESRLFTRTEESLYYNSAQRLIAVWPTRFRLPEDVDAQHQEDRFADGKRNAMLYVRQPRKLAEFVYGGRMGNGPEGSGDGWLYRGRGLKQLTGRTNYLRYSAATGVDCTGQPERLALDPMLAADSAGWYWSSVDANALLDAGVLAVTKAINGGVTDLARRIELTNMAMEALA